jgi:large subunit ribosomal protein L11
MAPRKILRRLRIELDAGNAAMADLGKMLGPYGLNLREIMLAYNEATAAQRGDRVPIEVTVFEDRTYHLRFLNPPTSFLLRKAAAMSKGAASPGTETVAVLSEAQLLEIAQRELPELNTDDLAAAMRTVAGTARSMGIRIENG